MIEAPAPRAILLDDAIGFGLGFSALPAARSAARDDAAGAAFDGSCRETGGDVALRLPALHDARRAVNAVSGRRMPDALVAREEGT